MTSGPIEVFLTFLWECEMRYHMAETGEQEANTDPWKLKKIIRAYCDICLTDHAQAESFGVQSAEVWVDTCNTF